MEGEELPPVVAVFKADIAEFMAKVEEVKLALDSIGNQRSGFARVEADAAAARREIDSGVRRSLDDVARAADNVGRSSERAAQTSTTAWDRWLARMKTMFPEVVDRYHASIGELKDTNEEAARKMEADFRRAFQQIVDKDAREAFQRIIAHTDEADRDWRRWLADMETLFPGVTEQWDKSLAHFKEENANASAKMESDFRRAFQRIAEDDARTAFAQINAYATRSADDVTTTWGARTREAMLFAQEIEGEQSRLAEDARRDAFNQSRIEATEINRRMDMWRGMFDQIAADERRAAAEAERLAFERNRIEATEINRRIDMWRGMFDQIEQGERDFRRRMEGLDALAPGTSATYERAVAAFRQRMGSAADGMQRDFDRAFFNIADRDARRAFDSIITDAGRAGDDAGRGFWSRFGRGGNGMFAGLAPGGRRPNWGALIGGLLPILSPAVAGIATPLVSGLETLTPALAGSAVSAVFAKDAFGEVTKAATALETQTNKYNTAADNTARYLQSDSQAMSDWGTLLSQVTPAQADMLNQLRQQDVTWGSLSTSQQNAVIGLRDTAALYKVLPKSVQDSVNALLAEKAAYDKLEPSQAQALTNHQAMHDAYDKLRTAAMPSMFDTIAKAEQAAADAMKPLLPVIQGTAQGWGGLFTKLDGWFKSADYAKFTDMWSANARGTIDAIGTAVGNVALGFIHMWEALSPMIGPSEQWLKNWSEGFANWANTPKGAAALQHFMEDLQKNGPATWGALSNIAHSLGNLIAALAWNPISMQALQDITGLVRWASGTTIGKAIINIGAWALAIYKLAQSFGALALAQKLLGGSGAASAAGAAASAAGAAGLNLATAGEARAMGIAGAGATLGETAAVGEGAAAGGLMSRITGALGGVGAGLAGLGTPGIAALLGVPLIVGGITYYRDKVREASDRAKGVIEDSSGRLSAGWSVGGVHMSQAFHDLANKVRDQSQTTADTVATSGNYAAGRFGVYREDWKKSNDALTNVLYLGQTQLGQSAAVFVKGFGYNVAEMGGSLKKQGKTLNQALLDSMDQWFMGVGPKSKTYWKGLQDTWAQNLDTFFSKQRKTTETDYNALQQAEQKLDEDKTHGLIANRKKDEEALLTASLQYMDDYNNGLISDSSKNIKKLSADVAKYMKDSTDGQSTAAQADLEQLKKDLIHKWDDVKGKVDDHTSASLDQEIASSQADIARIMGQVAANPLHLPGQGGGYASGGLTDGPGTGTSDSIVRVSNREFVVNAKSTAEHLPLLEAINRGFSAGGFVRPEVPRLVDDQRAYGEQIAINIAKQAAQVAGAAASAGVSGTVAQWIFQGMRAAGVSGTDWANGLGIIAKNESGGNPNAINLSDSNAAMGDPSRGLMQEIGATFNAYHVPGTSDNIFDPVANVASAVRYIEATYGGIDNVPGVRSVRHGGGYLPYDNGGWLMPGVTAALNMTGQPEAVFTQPQLQALMQGGGEVVIPITIEMDGRKVWQSTRRVNLQQQRRNGKSTYSYGNQRIL